MCVYLRVKFEAFSLIVTSFTQEGEDFNPPPEKF